MSDWVKCPICGEGDMRKEKDDEIFYIHCTNGNCGSNGGDNFDGIPEMKRKTPRVDNFSLALLEVFRETLDEILEIVLDGESRAITFPELVQEVRILKEKTNDK